MQPNRYCHSNIGLEISGFLTSSNLKYLIFINNLIAQIILIRGMDMKKVAILIKYKDTMQHISKIWLFVPSVLWIIKEIKCIKTFHSNYHENERNYLLDYWYFWSLARTLNAFLCLMSKSMQVEKKNIIDLPSFLFAPNI